MKAELKRLFEEHLAQPVPKGLSVAVEDLDIEVFSYAGDIAGYVSTYLKGGQVNVKGALIDEALSHRLAQAEAKIQEFRAYKEQCDEVARLLLECLAQDRGQ